MAEESIEHNANTTELNITQDAQDGAKSDNVTATNTQNITEHNEAQHSLLKAEIVKLIGDNKPTTELLDALFAIVKDPIIYSTNITVRLENGVAELAGAVLFAEEFLHIKAKTLNISYSILLSNKTIAFEGLEGGNCHASYIIGKEILFNNSQVNPGEFGTCKLLGAVELAAPEGNNASQQNEM